MYVDMVKAGTVDNTVLTTDRRPRRAQRLRRGQRRRSTQTGPNLARDVKDQNATLYDNLAMVPAPLGKSNVTGKGLMSISVKDDTKFPNASMALAQFFTNPRSMVEFAKQVAIYPSTAGGVRRPVLLGDRRRPIEDSARPLAKDIVSTYADIVPTDPEQGRRQRRSSSRRSSRRCSTTSTAQQALSDAVTEGQRAVK